MPLRDHAWRHGARAEAFLKICCCFVLLLFLLLFVGWRATQYLSRGSYGIETIWYLTLDAHWGWSCGGVWDAAAMPALPLAYINTGFSVVRLLCLSVCLICSTSFEYDVNLAPWIKEECEVIFIRRSCLLTAYSSWMRLRPVDCKKEYGLLGKTNTCSCSSFCFVLGLICGSNFPQRWKLVVVNWSFRLSWLWRARKSVFG